MNVIDLNIFLDKYKPQDDDEFINEFHTQFKQYTLLTFMIDIIEDNFEWYYTNNDNVREELLGFQLQTYLLEFLIDNSFYNQWIYDHINDQLFVEDLLRLLGIKSIKSIKRTQ